MLVSQFPKPWHSFLNWPLLLAQSLPLWLTEGSCITTFDLVRFNLKFILQGHRTVLYLFCDFLNCNLCYIQMLRSQGSTIRLTTTSSASTKRHRSSLLKPRNNTSSTLTKIICIWIWVAGVWLLSVEHLASQSGKVGLRSKLQSMLTVTLLTAQMLFGCGYTENHSRNAPGQSG